MEDEANQDPKARGGSRESATAGDRKGSAIGSKNRKRKIKRTKRG
jgi:hypothetical protein